MTNTATTNLSDKDLITGNLPYLGKSLLALGATVPLDYAGALGNLGTFDDPTSSLMAVLGGMAGYFGRARDALMLSLPVYALGKGAEAIIKYNQGLRLEDNLNPDYLKTLAVGGLAALAGYGVNQWENYTGKNAFKTLGYYLLEQGKKGCKKGWKMLTTRKPTPYEIKEAEQKTQETEIKYFKDDINQRKKEAKLKAWKSKKEAKALKLEEKVLASEQANAEKRKALGLYEKAENIVGYTPQGPQEPEIDLDQALDLE